MEDVKSMWNITHDRKCSCNKSPSNPFPHTSMLSPIQAIRCPRSHHPVLHRQPLTPALLRSLNLRNHRSLQWPHERHGFHWQHVVIPLHRCPATALGSKEIIPSLLFMQWSHAACPVVAKEPMQYTRKIKSCHNQPSQVWNQGYTGV